MREQLYDLTNLAQLISRAEISNHQLATSIGISDCSLITYLNGKTTVSLDVAIKLADYFSVSLDVIVGRCPLKQTGYGTADFVNDTHSARSLLNMIEIPAADAWYDDIPYPYSLVLGVSGDIKSIESVITEDQQKGIEFALSNALKPDVKDMVIRRCRDGESLAAIGRVYGVNAERIRQRVAKAFRILRTYPWRTYILDGFNEVDLRRREEEAENREQALLEREKSLEQYAQRLNGIEKQLRQRRDEIDLSSSSDGLVCESINFVGQFTDIEVLGLSARAYCCLYRIDARTFKDILDLAKDGRYMKIRNLGRATWKEIVSKMAAFGYPLPEWGK